MKNYFSKILFLFVFILTIMLSTNVNAAIAPSGCVIVNNSSNNLISANEEIITDTCSDGTKVIYRQSNSSGDTFLNGVKLDASSKVLETYTYGLNATYTNKDDMLVEKYVYTYNNNNVSKLNYYMVNNYSDGDAITEEPRIVKEVYYNTGAVINASIKTNGKVEINDNLAGKVDHTIWYNFNNNGSLKSTYYKDANDVTISETIYSNGATPSNKDSKKLLRLEYFYNYIGYLVRSLEFDYSSNRYNYEYYYRNQTSFRERNYSISKYNSFSYDSNGYINMAYGIDSNTNRIINEYYYLTNTTWDNHGSRIASYNIFTWNNNGYITQATRYDNINKRYTNEYYYLANTVWNNHGSRISAYNSFSYSNGYVTYATRYDNINKRITNEYYYQANSTWANHGSRIKSYNSFSYNNGYVTYATRYDNVNKRYTNEYYYQANSTWANHGSRITSVNNFYYNGQYIIRATKTNPKGKVLYTYYYKANTTWANHGSRITKVVKA